MSREQADELDANAVSFMLGGAVMALLALVALIFTSVGETGPRPLNNLEIRQAAAECERIGLATRFETTVYGRPISYTCTSERYQP